MRLPKTLTQVAATAMPHPDHIVEIHKRIVAAAGQGGTPDHSSVNIAKHAADVFGNMPHPQIPELKVNEVSAYERVAWMMGDRQPTVADVAHAAATLKGANISPSDFESTWAVARPVANRLLDGRDPTIVQMQHLIGKSPSEIHDYYMGHPFPGYEEVTAGQMARSWRAAEAVARQYGQVPNHNEVSRFAVAGYTADDMHQHYGGG